MKINGIKRLLAGAAALVFGIAAVTGCSAGNAEEIPSGSTSGSSQDSSPEGGEKEKVELHLADMSLYGIAIFNYAKEVGILDGYFDDLNYDITVTLTEWASGVEQNSAFAAGEIDFSSMGNIPAVSGSAGGFGTKILAVNFLYDNEYALVARNDSDINSIADLEGKSVGTYIGTVTHYAIAKYLETAGLDITDVNLLNIASEATTAIRNGDVDATAVGNVIAHQLEEEGTAHILSDNQVPIYNYVVGREAFAEKYPEITVKVLELINDTWAYALEHQQDYIEFYAGVSGTEVSVIEASWKENFPIKTAKNFSEDDYNQYVEFIDWMKSVEYVSEDVDPDSLLDLTYVAKISNPPEE